MQEMCQESDQVVKVIDRFPASSLPCPPSPYRVRYFPTVACLDAISVNLRNLKQWSRFQYLELV